MAVTSETISVSSKAFRSGGMIPERYTSDGEDVNPPLTLENIPEEAKSIALIVDDPDAPSGTYVHWVVWNIDPSVRRIEEDSVPHGAVRGTNDFRRLDYGGPCPPSGVHRYYFKFYALDTMLDLASGSTKTDLEHAMEGHIIARGMLMGRYTRE